MRIVATGQTDWNSGDADDQALTGLLKDLFGNGSELPGWIVLENPGNLGKQPLDEPKISVRDAGYVNHYLLIPCVVELQAKTSPVLEQD